MEAENRGSQRIFLGILLLLLVTRAILVLSIADVFFFEEEAAKCAAAKGLLDGVGIPSWQLNYAYHEGGGFLVSHLDALLFLGLGECVLVPKIAAILTTAILFAVGWRFTEELYGSKASAIFGLLFVLCPDAFLRYSLISIGTHFEALILIALVLQFGMRVLFREKAPWRDWALLGLFSGLGAYVSLQTAPAIATIALALVLLRRFSRTGIAVALAGFAVGGIPLWWMMSHVGTAALRVRSYAVFTRGSTGWHALRELLHPLAAVPDPWSWLRVVGIASVIALGLRLAAGEAGRALRARCALLLAYLAIYLVSYASSGHAAANDGLWTFWLRAAPLWFFSTVMFGGCAAFLLRRAASRGGQAALAALVLMLVAGLSDFASLLRRARPSTPVENWRLLVTTKGYDLSEYFDKLVRHFEDSLPLRYSILVRFRDEPEHLLPAAMHSLFEHSGRSLPEAVEFARIHAGDRWTTALLGLGLVAAPPYGHDVQSAFAAVEAQPEEARPALAEAVGRVTLGLKITPEKLEEQARMKVPESLREPFLRGAGWRVHRMHRMRPDRALALIDRLPGPARPAVLRGYLEARAANTLK